MKNWNDLREAIVEGAVKRLRPKVMTVGVMFLGLIPIMWSTGAGADVMKRIAAPMIGGIFTSFILELVVYPAIYAIWKWHFEVKKEARVNALSADISLKKSERRLRNGFLDRDSDTGFFFPGPGP